MAQGTVDLQRAIAALRQARLKIEALERARSEAIAVVGMACRFPGAAGPEAFWRLLRDGRNPIVEVPPERWVLDDYYDPDPLALGRTNSRHGGFVADALDFEPERFGISEAEAEAMDPQQRLLIEVAAEAFERAGDAELEGSNTGVFVGISTHDYAQRALRDEATEAIGVYTGTGNAFSTAVGRIAYVFGLHGPVMALDTACSSTLVAAHLACESLRAGSCDQALVAGVNLLLSPAMTVYFTRLGVLAPDGLCRSFDADANGYVRAEGCGALVLRRLGDAQREGDPILGLIRGSAVNSNGRGNGLTAPSRRAQVQVIRRALAAADLEPGAVTYVEAFGSATPQGDAVELRALSDVFAGRPSGDLPIASVKSNIGHAEAASGAASLIKALLCLEHGALPASLHHLRPNPALDDGASPIRVLQTLEAWPEARPRIAGVSGFGFGGTNAHLVLEAAPPRPARPESQGTPAPQLIVLSARTSAALEQRRAALAAQLITHPETALADLARGCAAVRLHEHRLAFTCTDLDGAAAGLRGDQGALTLHLGQVEGAALDMAAGCGAGPVHLAPVLARAPAAHALVERAAAVLGATPRTALDPHAPLARILEAAALLGWRALGLRLRRVEGRGASWVLALCDGSLSVEDALAARGPDQAPAQAPAQARAPAHRIDLASPDALDTLAALVVRGFDPRWDRVHDRGPRVSLPPHPSARRRLADLPLVPRSGASREPSPSTLLVELLAAPLPRRRDHLERWLSERLGAILGGELPADRPLVELGLDSVAIVEAIQTIQRELDLQVYPEELLGAHSLAALADLLAAQLGRRHAADAEPKVAPPAERAAARRHIAAHGAGPAHPQPTLRLPSAVFVLSAPRCGSTLLRAMLAGHPGLFAPPELHLLDHGDMASWHRALAPRMMHLGLVQALIGLGLEAEAASTQIQTWVDEARPTADVYAALQALAGPRLLVDKSPSHALEPRALARAEAVFDEPRYIVLTRHPYAMIESFARLRMGQLFDAGERDPELFAEAVWERAYTNLEQLQTTLGPRCHRLAFEDLVTEPERTLTRLCAFLELPFDPATLDPFAGERMVGGEQRAIGFIGDPNFGSRTRIDPRLAERWRDTRSPWRLDPATASLARSLGYSTPVETQGQNFVDPSDPAADARSALPLEVAPRCSTSLDDELLLTGATGFLGVHLAAELLAQTDQPLRCLVRASTPAAATERVRAAMIHYGLWREQWHERIRGEVSDLAAPELGLTPERWDTLARSTSAIYHNGAQVHFGLPYAALRGPNVEGTRALLRLAAAGRGKPLHFVSTKGVFSPGAYPGDAAIPEDAPVRQPRDGLAYQQSKWAAEQLVIAAREHGLETAVYRPGRIGGQSHSGQVNPDDLLCRILRSCAQVAALPDVDICLEVTPVDHVAAALVRISRTPDACGRAYNLAHREPLSIAALHDALASAGHSYEFLPWKTWRQAVLSAPHSPLAALAGLFGDSAPPRVDEARLSADNTRAADPGWTAPDVVDQLLLDIDFMRRAGLFGEPGS